MSIPIGQVYAGLILKGRIKIDDVPDEYKDDTNRVLSGEADEDEPEPIEPGINGAINLKPITIKESYNMLNNIGKETIKLGYNAIFNPNDFAVLPENIQYSIKRVENIYGKYRTDVNVTVDTIDNSGIVIVNGFPSASIQRGDTMLRIDLEITSSNYEPMNLTIYIESA